MRESSASLFLWRPWPASLLVRRIQTVEPASQGRPFDPADRAVALLGVVEAVALDGGALHLLRDRIERRAGLLHGELHVAGALGTVHPHEGLDRTSVVEGKGVYVRVDLGGRRTNKKKHNQIN